MLALAYILGKAIEATGTRFTGESCCLGFTCSPNSIQFSTDYSLIDRKF